MGKSLDNKIVQMAKAVMNWFRADFLGLIRSMRGSYVPPLMVYFAAGVSGFTGIIETFFVKEKLGLTATALASLGFWAGLPWALKMPLGHLVDLYWRWKALFVYLGAAVMGASLMIMVGLTGYPKLMSTLLHLDTWYVLSVLLSSMGYVLQDVVADAMTVEAVPTLREDGASYPSEEQQQMHVTMQTLGRIAIVGGGALVAGTGGWLAKVLSYEAMYWMSLSIPAISVLGVVLASWKGKGRPGSWKASVTQSPETAGWQSAHKHGPRRVDWPILGGSAVFVALTLALGLSAIDLKEEIVLIGSLAVIVFLMGRLIRDLDPVKRREIIGIAVIIFVFRAMPGPGAGASWWQMDVLGFDEAFFGTLRQVSSILTIAGMLTLRGWMGRRSLPYLVVFLSLYGTVMFAPFIGMFYGLHEWTEAHFGFGARTIAVIDTMADSPLGQVAMIPMLAWIAKEAPREKKATYFAVMAAFTNLALSASQLATKVLNNVFVVQRGQYNELGMLMIAVALLGLVLPVVTVFAFQWKGAGKARR